MNKLFMISGVSGSGKTTISNKLSYNQIVSFTTRESRDGEVNGVDYCFISKEEYAQLLADGELIESVEYGENYYGLTREEVETKLSNDHAFVVVDFHGMEQLKELYPYSTSIFISSDKGEIIKRMKSRGDNDENIAKRLTTYNMEMQNRVHYDYVVKNNGDKLDKVVKIVKSIVEMETTK